MKDVKVSGPDLYVGEHAVAFETLEELALNESPYRSRAMLTGRSTAPSRPVATAARAKGRDIPDPVYKYAPVVYLHPKEKYFPASVKFFIKYSSLRWSNAGLFAKDAPVAGRGTVSAHKLGRGGYSHKDSGRVYRCNEFTAPRKNDRPAEGFFLDLEKSKRKGQGTNVPVYYQYKARHYIIYWFFYCFNSKSVDRHEGDWENITVCLNGRNRATAVAYYGHGKPTVIPWSRVPKKKGRPVVYSAAGSHASYPTKGAHSLYPLIKDYTDQGRLWRTWRHLRSVKLPWYGFGGGWGEVGNVSDTSGPVGPGHKFPVPGGW